MVFGRICPVFGVEALRVEMFYCPHAFDGNFVVGKRRVELYSVFKIYKAVGNGFYVVAYACYETESCNYNVVFFS